MLDKIFNPKSFEHNFSFEREASLRKPGADPFMVLLPPPNVTGSLHMGHALCYTIQDIIARYKRLKGYDVLFQPGLDHAGIVTQLLVEKNLYENGVEKGTLTRETLLKEIWFYKENSGNTILDQMKVLGISCDFARLRFTMDDGGKKAVTAMFVKLFNDGLIYRGKRIVNWDTLIGSAISDLEIVEKEVDGNLWYIRYMFADDSDDYITVATTRPETLFGDTAVAVNPDDIRYKHLIGREVIIPLIGRKIRIIGDKYADPEKGTGAVKITPAHDFNDYDVGQRNRLPIIEIMNFKGELNENVPEIFQMMDRLEARSKVVDLLDKKGLLEKVEKIRQKVPFGDRSDVPLEPMITHQWFVNAEKLAYPAIKAVEDGKIKFIPKHWENLYFEWLNNVRPWCISRQIWWGHRIPAWYGPDGQVFVAENMEEAMEKAVVFYGKNHVELTQDEDVLDTWFSSGMWPFVTLGWPKDTDDLKRFYSNMIVVTGFDIIFFWIARMIMLGIYSLNEVPFSDVYIHGLVRDEKGRKMSKSRGNVMNPLDMCKKYGSDAVRYTLASLSSPGRDVKINEQLVESGRNFLTKIWNVVRFAQMNSCVYNREFKISDVTNPIAKWIIYRVNNMVIEVENSMKNYRIDEVTHSIYHCMWNSFCDWYMELIKPILQKSLVDDVVKHGYDLNLTLLKKDVRDTTAWAIIQFLRVLYPICPFIVKRLSGEMGIIDMVWPDVEALDVDFSEAIEEVELLKTIISSARSVKQCLRIPLSSIVNIRVESSTKCVENLIMKYGEALHRMAGVSLGEISTQTVPIVVGVTVIHMEVGNKIDIVDECSRLSAELLKLEQNRDAALMRLSSNDFLGKATEDVIEEHKNRVKTLNEKINKIQYVIKSLEVV
ncbi:MAG: valine--tRNA ligase [Holosporaceae bacterium]|jgi:valyl-tRNA synthetase|nr:valine--tRNA ligase [Holosporaceae bacterium]